MGTVLRTAIGCAALWACAAIARAAVPVALPATERPEDWRSILALGDLSWGSAGSPIVVSDRGTGTWTVSVTLDGDVRTASVARPTSADQREDVVWLLVSLLAPIAAPAPAPAPVEPSAVASPALPPVPTAEHPVPSDVATGPRTAVRVGEGGTNTGQPAPPTSPRPDPLADLPDPIVPPPRPAPPPAPAAPSPRPLRPLVKTPTPAPEGVRPYGALTTRLDVRVGLLPAVLADLSGGVAVEHVELGLGAAVGPPTPLPAAGEDRRFSGTHVYAELGYAAQPARFAADLGVELRVFRESGDVVKVGPMPFVRLVAGVTPYLGRHVWLEPTVGYAIALGSTQVRVDGNVVQELPTGAFEAAVAVRLR